MDVNQLGSWGIPPKHHNQIFSHNWLSDLVPDCLNEKLGWIPRGRGRSYGDVSLNPDGGILLTSSLNRFIEMDFQTGVLKAEAGITIGKILSEFSNRGWFLEVIPGTQHVTLGGAVANDIHGKSPKAFITVK